MKLRKSLTYLLCDTILSTYGYAFERFYPEIAVQKRVVWVPHSASPDFMLAFNEYPENAIFLSGAISDYYPLRQVMKGSYERHTYPIVWHRHPGYHCSYDHERDERIGHWQFDEATHAIHLWNEMWRRNQQDKNHRYHPDCLYEQLKRKYLG